MSRTFARLSAVILTMVAATSMSATPAAAQELGASTSLLTLRPSDAPFAPALVFPLTTGATAMAETSSNMAPDFSRLRRPALLPALYAGARAFALPSLHEGFGLTALEAMAAGVPVVASTRPALPELVIGAGLLADPDDRGPFAAAVVTAATDEQARAQMRDEGLRVAARYTWERAALRIHELLSRL